MAVPKEHAHAPFLTQITVLAGNQTITRYPVGRCVYYKNACLTWEHWDEFSVQKVTKYLASNIFPRPHVA